MRIVYPFNPFIFIEEWGQAKYGAPVKPHEYKEYDMEVKISKDSVFHVAEDVSWRDIKGELIVLQLSSGEYFSFNEIGRLAWISLAEHKSIGQVIEAVLAEYDVSLAQAEADVVAFVQGLLGNKLLIQQPVQEIQP